MKILHYIPSIDATSGGLGAYMQITTPELGKLVELHVATHHTDKELPLKNCTMHYISGSGINVGNRIKDEVFALIEEVHPDIIHINCCWTPLCSYFTIWAKELCKDKCIHIPIIYTPHGMLEPWIIAHNYWTRKVPATMIYQRKAIKCADLVHSTASSEHENLEKLGWNKNIEIISNCVDVNNIKVKDSWHSRKKILFLSRVHEKKGINFIIEAAAQLKSELSGYTISIVGPGEGKYVQSLKNMTKNLGVNDIVKFEEPVFGDKKFDLYRNADLFLLPTYSENFGIVVAEALASGTPVITTKGTPWEELNTHNCGWWVEIGTSPLVNALRDFLSKTDTELETMGHNGRLLIENKYSCQFIAQQFQAMYRKLLNRRLTILHYIPRVDKQSGGLGTYMQLLSEELGKHCNLHILTHRHKDNLPLENCELSYLSSIIPSPLTKYEFIKVLNYVKPDVVHVNTCWLPLSAYTVMWAKEAGYKVILTPHGMLDTLIIKHNYWTRKVPAILYYQRKAVEKADIIHSTSKRERRILNHLGWNKNIQIIPNGVNISKIRNVKTESKNRTILYLGRIHPQKGINHIIEAVGAIKNKLKKHQITVKIVGMGDSSYVNELKEMSTRLGNDDIITFKGPMFGEKKWQLFNKSSLFILPSYSESFGIAVAEALASRTPVITTTGTPWEEIMGTKGDKENENQCGWWIDIGTQPLINALNTFIDTPEDKLAKMGENGRHLIESKYSITKVVEEIIKLYCNIRIWK